MCLNRKTEILDALLELLRAELDDCTRAARDAAAYATDDEARAESKWDTQGTEASYLAAGQAGRARELAGEIAALEQARAKLLEPVGQVRAGALATCELAHGPEVFFVVPVAGGRTVRAAGLEVTTITPAAPIAMALDGKAAPAAFTLPNGNAARLERVE